MFYWPGCEVQIRDLNPNQCLPYFGPPTMDELRSSIETSLELFKANNSDFAGKEYPHISCAPVGHLRN